MTEEDLAALFMETGKHHHAAFAATKGGDPEWPFFYSGYLQTKIWDAFGAIPTRSELIHFLIEADRAFRATGRKYEEWPAFYAKMYLDRQGRA